MPQETLSSRAFQFEVKPGARTYNQAHYEALGEVGLALHSMLTLVKQLHLDIQYCSVHWTLDKTVQVITEEVYVLLESRGGLERREVVLTEESEASSSKKSSSRGGDGSGVRSFVFVSPGFESKERLQVKTEDAAVWYRTTLNIALQYSFTTAYYNTAHCS